MLDKIRKHATRETLRVAFTTVACPALMAVGLIGSLKSYAMISGLVMGTKTPVDPLETLAYTLFSAATFLGGGAGCLHEITRDIKDAAQPETVVETPRSDGPA